MGCLGGRSGEPRRTDYAYTIEARAGDRIGRIEGFTPRQSWQEVTITLLPPPG